MGLSCILLAGGRGVRLGTVDKGLLEVAGRPLVALCRDSLSPCIDELIISANHNLDAYRSYGDRVIADLPGYRDRGPLAGLASCLPACRHDRVLVTTVDCPLVPAALITALQLGLGEHEAAICSLDQRLQALFIIDRRVQAGITEALDAGQPQLMRWLQSLDHVLIPARASPPWLSNLNTAQELERFRALLATTPAPWRA